MLFADVSDDTWTKLIMAMVGFLVVAAGYLKSRYDLSVSDDKIHKRLDAHDAMAGVDTNPPPPPPPPDSHDCCPI